MIGRALVAAVAGVAAVLLSPAPQPASAGPCPDIEVVFARGSGEPPGLGGVGQAFVDAVRARAAGRSVDVYAVNYAASSNFSNRPEIAATVADGIRDEAAHLRSIVAACPDTRLILGGYSQGAALTGMLTSSVVPTGAPAPLPSDVPEHVAAVVFFGKPAGELVSRYSVSSVAVGPRYAAKALDLCAPGDAVCEGVLAGPRAAHRLYPVNGMVGQAAQYAVSRL